MQTVRSWLARAARALGLLLMLCPLAGQDAGLPFIRNFSPKEYGADAQNWAVAQGPRGWIYVANNQGVLVYDGARWGLIRTPGRTTVRSLAEDADGRIFVGAVGELGCLARDASGRMAFVSLADKLPPEARTFTDVWTTRATPRGILFQSREELLLYIKTAPSRHGKRTPPSMWPSAPATASSSASAAWACRSWRMGA
jgi:hypothetical protein